MRSGKLHRYGGHLARPADDVMERWKYATPNFSLRMGNLPAAIVLPQLGAVLADRCTRWNQRYAWLSEALAGIPGLHVPPRDAREQFVASSLQFSVQDLDLARMQAFVAACADAGVFIRWFGADAPAGHTSAWRHWRFFGDQAQELPNADRILGGLCDLRLPLHLSQKDCTLIGERIRSAKALVDARVTA